MKPTVILLRESARDSLIKDAGSVVAALAMILPGALLDIATLEFIGGLMFLLWLLGRSMNEMRKNTLTIDEARARLDELATPAKGAGHDVSADRT